MRNCVIIVIVYTLLGEYLWENMKIWVVLLLVGVLFAGSVVAYEVYDDEFFEFVEEIR